MLFQFQNKHGVGTMDIGTIQFSCPDQALVQGFTWAKEQALSYVHTDDGHCWYEAALPGRNAFCMRDVCHMASGAYFLGLQAHTKNMLYHFAKNIAESRDYCTFWEICGGSYVPAAVDYQNDQDFWYNLPANFDMLACCRRMFALTGDRSYLDHPAFRRFYDWTMHEYIARWDHDGDGIPDRAVPGLFRGIPSYDETNETKFTALSSDLIASQIAACRAYAQITGEDCWNAEASRLCSLLEHDWWSGSGFYGARNLDGRMLSSKGSIHLLAYFDAITDKHKRQTLLNDIQRTGESGVIVELLSHYSEVFYGCSQPDRGLFWLRAAIDPSLPRRNYPELSFSVIGAYVQGLMGVKLSAPDRAVETAPHLPDACLTAIPFLDGSLDLICENGRQTLLNHTSTGILWNGQAVAPSI